MAGLVNYDCDGVLTIGGIVMNRPAWAVTGDGDGEGSLFDLLIGVEQRGEDRLMPFGVGVIPYRRRITVTTHTLRLLVVGDVDENGDPTTDHTDGLRANLAYLMANVVAPVATSAGTRAATWDPPAGATQLSAAIHVTGITKKKMALGDNAVFEGTLNISVPAGAFT